MRWKDATVQDNISFDGENHVLLASEDPEVACNISMEKISKEMKSYWIIPGGCMSIVPIPGKRRNFLQYRKILFKSNTIFS